MITLTKLDAKLLELDPDQIERVDATPGTVLTMVNGTKHLVEEEISEVIERVRQSRASLLAGPAPSPGTASPQLLSWAYCRGRTAAARERPPHVSARNAPGYRLRGIPRGTRAPVTRRLLM